MTTVMSNEVENMLNTITIVGNIIDIFINNNYERNHDRLLEIVSQYVPEDEKESLIPILKEMIPNIFVDMIQPDNDLNDLGCQVYSIWLMLNEDFNGPVDINEVINAVEQNFINKPTIH